MHASITTRDLSWTTPDGNRLFSQLDLVFTAGRTGLIGDNGCGKTTLLRILAGELPPSSGTVNASGRVAMMRQSATGGSPDTVADLFGITADLARLQRIETDAAEGDDLALADWSVEPRMHESLSRVGLTGLESARSLSDLSGGETTRVQLAALIFAEPDILLLDEPTNNLDIDGREAVRKALAGWHGTAIVASHDRTLLEEMETIVELGPLGARTYGGNWSAYRARRALDLLAAEHRRDVAEHDLHRIERQTQVRRERKERRDGRGHRRRAKGDQPKILLNAMRNRSQQTGGSQARLADRQRAAATEALALARSQIAVLQPITMTLEPTGLPPGKSVVETVDLTGGPCADLPVIHDLSMMITGPERVAVTGRNGSGKTTLLRLLTGKLEPLAGNVRLHVRTALLDQHMSLLDPRLSVADNYRSLNPHTGDTACRSALARFLFRSEAALQTVATLSGGEKLRAALAAVLGGPQPPELLVLDEPTNHLDLRAMEALETALRAYDGALLVVSHDTAFLEAIGVTRRIDLDGREQVELIL